MKKNLTVINKFIEFSKTIDFHFDERVSFSDEDIINNIITLDLNNDKQLDIIVPGMLKSETHFFLQNDSSFEKIFRTRSIVNLRLKNGMLDKLYVYEGDFRNLINSVYQVHFNDNKHTLTLIWQSIELVYHPKRPETYFNNPVKFIVDHEVVNLRFDPYIDNSTRINHFKITGNVIAQLPIGTKGMAYASKKDASGNIWLYVVIEPSNINNHIFSDQLKSYTRLVGWINKGYLAEQQ